MFFLIALLLLSAMPAIGFWHAFARPRRTFLREFANLLDRPEFVDGLANRLIHRWFLKGEFHGRKVVVLLQNGRGRYPQKLVVSMETGAAVTMETYEFGAKRGDRETESALYDLEVKYEVRLRHDDRCLKGLWSPTSAWSFFSFPPDFEPVKWHRVLEDMHTVAGSIERRAA